MITVSEKLYALRAVMKANQIDAWIILTGDPHQSEYCAEYWEGRQWLSNFTGSAGTLLVLQNKAALWVDGRYFIQAEQELAGIDIQLMREGNEGVPSMGQFLVDNLEVQATVGIDGKVVSVFRLRELIKEVKRHSFSIKSDKDLLDIIWTNRPKLPENPIFLHEDYYAGRTREEKIEQMHQSMLEVGADYLLVSTLDDIAWIFNLRGADIECSPVFLAYALFSKKGVCLYTNDSRIEKDALMALKTSGVTISAYDAIASDLCQLPVNSNLQLDPAATSYSLMAVLPDSIKVSEAATPSVLMKAIKNEVELERMTDCHKRDGVAIVRFMRWLETAIESGTTDEVEIDERLQVFRAEHKAYKGPSFPTIAAYGANAAICHYRAHKATCLRIEPKGLLLVDSGGQYPDGTTDITRTFACGDITAEERRDYTLVLKSHIALATARFKSGTRGVQLDAIARQPLWASGLDFNHGTGHGIGYFLNVHEGPQNISTKSMSVALEPGMLVTNEPGMYRDGKHGIRIENVMVVEKDIETDFGEFYKLKPSTLAPIDIRPLDISLLTATDIKWLNNYHEKVLDELSPLLLNDDLAWLIQVTKAI